MNKKTKLLSILRLVTAILFLFSSEVLAQSLSISGKVIDKNSQEPVIGASVLIEGTSNGTITDLDGNFMLSNVPSKGSLVVSYIGYVSQEIPLKSSQTNVRIQLVEDTQALDEVVVVGYGTQSKKDITGSVAVFLQTLSTRLRWRLSPRLCKEKHPVCISLIPEVPAVRLRSVFVVWVLLIVQTR